MLFSCLCSACSLKNEEIRSTPTPTSLPPLEMGIPADQINTKVVLYDEKPTMGTGQNSYKNNEDLFLFIKNSSNQRIVLPGNFGVKIYYLEDANWIQVKNRTAYPENDTLLLPDKEFNSGDVVVITPYIPNLQNPVLIRVMIAGHIQDHPDQLVGSYLDVKINP
jgi:hypothetical protein